MNITLLLEQMAVTPHHKINIENLLKESHPDVHQAFVKNDISSLKTILNGSQLLADRNTIFEI